MFERLVLDGYENVMLTTQHRMTPQVSAIPRLLTYPELLDAPSTSNYPPLKGFHLPDKRLYFFDHDHLEDNVTSLDGVGKKSASGAVSSVLLSEATQENKSKTNSGEADLCVEMVRFLLYQGYQPNQLVILSTYLGQLRVLQEKIKQELDQVQYLVCPQGLQLINHAILHR